MILRRFGASLRRQDWTAVVVELAVAPDGKTLLRIGFRSRP